MTQPHDSAPSEEEAMKHAEAMNCLCGKRPAHSVASHAAAPPAAATTPAGTAREFRHLVRQWKESHFELTDIWTDARVAAFAASRVSQARKEERERVLRAVTALCRKLYASTGSELADEIQFGRGLSDAQQGTPTGSKE